MPQSVAAASAEARPIPSPARHRRVLRRVLAATVVLVSSLPLGAETVPVIRDLVYGVASGAPLLLDVRPGDGPTPQPVAILIHGGGWASGDKSGTDKPNSSADITPWFPHLRAAGFVAFSINYRLAPTHHWPACAEDVATAIRWVKAHAADSGGDPTRIVLFGHSAGGHLAFWAGLTADAETSVQAIVGYAPVTDLALDTTNRHGLSISLQQLFDRPAEPDEAAWQQLRAASPVNRLHPGAPPMLIVHGDADVTVPLAMSEALVTAAHAQHLTCDLIMIPGAAHRLKNWSALAPDYETAVTAWLKRTLGP